MSFWKRNETEVPVSNLNPEVVERFKGEWLAILAERAAKIRNDHLALKPLIENGSVPVPLNDDLRAWVEALPAAFACWLETAAGRRYERTLVTGVVEPDERETGKPQGVYLAPQSPREQYGVPDYYPGA